MESETSKPELKPELNPHKIKFFHVIFFCQYYFHKEQKKVFIQSTKLLEIGRFQDGDS